jgi:hypothetical protein
MGECCVRLPEPKAGGRSAGGRKAVAAAIAAVALAAAGCGPPGLKVAPAGGTVTYKGNPVAGATVMFTPAKGTPCDGITDESGKYSVSYRGKPGAPVGPCRVTVTKPPKSEFSLGQAATTPEDLAKLSAAAAASPPKPAPKDKDAIPAKYARVETSGLTVEVTADAAKNAFDFKLDD